MLHLLIENNELKDKVFPLPDGVRRILQQTLDNYDGDKTIDGYKRLNNILNMKNISYHELKRIKNFFDHYIGSDKSAEFILNGGEPMKIWVNNTLNTATKAVRDFKKAKQTAGISNAFIKPHEKNRVKPTKPSTPDNLKQDLKEKRVIFITEKQKQLLKEAANDTFSLEELSNLRSFNAKFNYCTQHLGEHIGKGSSRATFQIDDEKVLKLAWNKNGVAQNVEEARAYGDDIFPEIYDKADDGSWIVSEFVLPAKASDFKHCFNLNFKQFCSFLYASGKYRFGNSYGSWMAMDREQWENLLETDPELAAFDDYIGNYGRIVIGDMVRICNYGLTKRNNEAHIVLLDSGFTEDVWNNYYKR